MPKLLSAHTRRDCRRAGRVRPHKSRCDLEFCEALAERVGVGAVPGSSFFREPVNHLIRLHFAKQKETLTTALERLESMKQKMLK